MKHILLKLLEEISEYPHDLSARTYLKNLIEELRQLTPKIFFRQSGKHCCNECMQNMKDAILGATHE